ncbi:hypothetical protein P9112_007800 [Eukaryota sp. TZLM1-RC]
MLPEFKQFADFLSSSHYLVPSDTYLNNKVVPDIKNGLEQELSGFLSSLTNAGCTLVFGGWKDVNGSFLLNILLVSNTFSFFVKSINISDENKSGYTHYLKLKEVVDCVGPNLITHIVSNSATNCLSACSLLIADYPHILFSPCASHTLDLLIEDMCKLPSFNKIISDCKKVVDFIRNHTIIKTKLEKVAGKTLMRPAATRFYTQFLMLSRLQDLEPSVKSLISSPTIERLVRDVGEPLMSSFRKVKLIVGSIEYDFWQLLSPLITYLKPLVGLLKLTDSIEPYFSKMYVKCRQLQEYYFLNSWEGMTDFEKYSVNGSINNRIFFEAINSNLSCCLLFRSRIRFKI